MKYWQDHIGDGFHTVLKLDLGPGEKQNKLKMAAIAELDEFLSHNHPTSLVIASAKPDSFCAGADIEEIRSVLGENLKLQELLVRTEGLLLRIHEAEFPVVAAISGACLGGGLELAMVCHARIASSNPKTVLGLPETSLGIIPGFGGTQMLPRIVGMQKALEMILGGAFKKLSAADALKCGLVSKVVEPEKLLDAARELAKNMAATGNYRRNRRKTHGIEKIPYFGKKLLLRGARKQVLAANKAFYPAPFAAIDAISYSSGDLRRGLSREHQLFSECARSHEAKSLVGLYFLREEARSKRWVEIQGKPYVPAPVGVVGAGLMGRGIALSALSANLPVILHDEFPEAAHDAVAFIEKALSKDVYKGKLTKAQAFARRDLLSVSFGKNPDGLRKANIVIEAIIENVQKKHELFEKLVRVLENPNAIIATNTSSILPSELAMPIARKDKFCAMHFFNPAERMELVEIAGIAETSANTLASVVALTKALGKTPVVLDKECPGLVVNRILLRGVVRAFLRMIQTGVDPWEIDSLLEHMGMMMGPFKTADLVGFDTADHVIKSMGRYYPDNYPKMVLDLNLKANKNVLGKKTGRGFYFWNGEKAGKPNPDIMEELELNPVTNGEAEIVAEMAADIMDEMRAEADALIEGGYMKSPDMIDLAMILGAGMFPNRRGIIGSNS